MHVRRPSVEGARPGVDQPGPPIDRRRSLVAVPALRGSEPDGSDAHMLGALRTHRPAQRATDVGTTGAAELRLAAGHANTSQVTARHRELDVRPRKTDGLRPIERRAGFARAASDSSVSAPGQKRTWAFEAPAIRS